VAATRARQWLVIGLRRIIGKGDETGAWRELATAQIPELEVSHEAEAGVDGPIANVDFEGAKRELDAARERSLAQSYSVLPITKLAHENQEQLVRAEEGLGKGMSWGRVMHRLFEALLRDPAVNVTLLAENLLKDEERDAAEHDEVLRTVSAVTSSPLWQRVLAADEKMAEVPFALDVSAAELGIEGAATTLLHGTVDLVFREGETWFIIDYKTDVTKGRIDALIAYYAPQVKHYANFWSRVTGAETKAGLFFVDGCREEWVV
jgi:ATP-dependent exoDNAse (exonuclease V) beta subunit